MGNGDPKTYPRAKALAATVNGGEPMAWKEYEDGSMVVILENGKKVTFEPNAKAEPEFVTESKDKLQNVVDAVTKTKPKRKVK